MTYLGDATRLKDALVFVNTPPPAEATLPNQWPFTVVISAADTGDHYIDLYSQYSRSRPYQIPQSKWGHLLPQWRFVDLSGNQVDRLKTTDTIIRDSFGNIIGVTGITQFYYIDDLPTLNYYSPVMLWATLDVEQRSVEYDEQGKPLPGYSNSKIIKGESYYINGQPPTYLEITSNGREPIQEIKWIRNPFRYTIVAKSDWLSNQCENTTSDDITVFDYPQVAAMPYAAVHEINRDVLGIPVTAENWLPLSAYFERYDENGFHTGGFQIGSIESSDTVLNTQISAEVSVRTYPWYRDIPYVWVSNPNARTINRVYLPYGFGPYYNPLLPTILPFSLSPEGMGSYRFPVSAVSGTPYWQGTELVTDIFGGIYGIAVNPVCMDFWAVDSELDMLFHIDVNGNFLTSVNIDPEGCSPQAIAMDSDKNMWVTLWGALSTIKFSSTGELLSAVAVPPGPILDDFLTLDVDSISVRPVQVDTDTLDNIWVSYEHPLSSMLLKYDSEGNYLLSAPLPPSAQPQGLVVNPIDNSVWVSDTYEILSTPYSWAYPASGGTVQHFNSAGTLIKSYSGIAHPDEMSLDRNHNVWFAFGSAGIGVISGSSLSQYYIEGNSIVPYNATHVAIDNSMLASNQKIAGLAVDIKNRVWVLNTDNNKAYVINADNPIEYTSVTIIPTASGGAPNNIQGLGDWTGWHWTDKYILTQSVLSGIDYVISGISNVFDINEFQDNFEIRRFNESWDAAQQINDYALSDHIFENVNLFQRYFRAMIGGLSANEESIGRKSYERIANFIPNHVDIDTCGIEQLYSLAEELDVPIDDYNINFPVKLRRLMDIISVSHQRLWGTRCMCRKNFIAKSTCTECGHSHCLNRGTLPIDQATYYVSGGVPFVIRPKVGNETYAVIEGFTAPTSGIPLSATSSLTWLQSANYSKYNFYNYLPTPCEVQVEGVINWDDDYTTLSEYNSSLSAWYNENELVDIMLNFNLHEGLQFNLE